MILRPFDGAAWELPAAACAGAVVGCIVTWLNARLGTPHGGSTAGRRRAADALVVTALAAAAAALWLWEVDVRGQLPPAAAGVPREVLAWRWVGHLVFVGLLAAAAWIDLRERVIPDGVTVPGVIVGLAWAALRPESLPPVEQALPRSFAAPLLQPDVLTLGGPLGDATLPAWLGAAPAAAGLAVAIVLFSAWWLGCTSPIEPQAGGRRPFDPRIPLLAAGITGITAAWWHGGAGWVALLSALVGLAAGVAVTWGTRIGASRALGREALGFGDVTLAAVIGTWLGWQGVVFACGLGVLVGLGHGLAQVVLSRDHEMPFGPSLCVGATLTIVLWRSLWERFGPAFTHPAEILAVVTAVVVFTALSLAAWRRFRGGPAA